MQFFLDFIIFAYEVLFKKLSLTVLKRFNLLLLCTYLTLFHKIDFYLVLEDKSSPYKSSFN